MNRLLTLLALGSALSLAACGEAPAETKTVHEVAAPEALGDANAFPTDLFAATAPEGAIGVKQAIDGAKVGQAVTVRGVIGGRKVAFVNGRAIVLLIDEAMSYCVPEEGCPTPWDYCCTPKNQLVANTLTVQVTDDDGQPISSSLQGVHGLRELATVIVEGVVRSTEGSVVLDATRIHLAEDGPLVGQR